MGKALDGVRILDFTHVQSGPTCTQLLAWFGADVIKVERAGAGDVTREQLRDIPGVDSLYFTMLNHNKRSITLDTKTPRGKAVLERLVRHCDVLVENFAPGALDRMGFTWERIQELNPRMIVASVKGFGPGPYEECKVYENVAQCAGGAASTTGFDDGPPLVTGAQIGDSGTGLHLALGIVCALYQRNTSGRGQKVLAAMQDGVLNLCRVKLRDQQRLARTGVMKEYPQYPNGKFGTAVPRAGNASGGGQPGSIVKCKGWETDPNAYLYFIAQYFPSPFANEQAARTANNGALPPDLSLIVKAREGNQDYVYSIVTGDSQRPPANEPVPAGLYYDPYFPRHQIAMPPPLRNGSVTFSDGTPNTIEQEAHDVVTFLAWASEPTMDERKRVGFIVMLYLIGFAVLLFFAYRRIWHGHHDVGAVGEGTGDETRLAP